MENKLLEIPSGKKQRLNEMFLAQMGAWVEYAIKHMYGSSSPNLMVRGHPTDIAALISTLAAEKKYIDSFLSNKLNDPEVTNNKWRLEQAIHNFEMETGIKWPIK